MEKIGTVKFNEWDCDVFKARYPANKQNALVLHDADDGDPVATASLCMVNEVIEDDEVIIKEYSENDGITNVLIEAGIIGKAIRHFPSGYVILHVHKLLK